MNLNKYIGIGVVIGIIAIFPYIVTHKYVLHESVLVMLSAYLASSWHMLGGYVGQYSLGHAAFFGVGAYTSTLLFIGFGISPWIGLLIGACFASLFGLLLGFLCFRYGVKGPYFLLLSLAYGEVFVLIATNVGFTRGELGITIPIQENNFFLFQFSEKIPYFHIIGLMLLCAFFLNILILRSRIGYFFLAIRESEASAQALGVNLMKYKLIATALSAFMMSIGGSFYAQYIMYINPSSVFGLHISVDALVYSIVGGLGTVFGPILGALVLVPIASGMRAWLGGSYLGAHQIIFGFILILVITFMPDGLMGLWEKLKINSRKFLRFRKASTRAA